MARRPRGYVTREESVVLARKLKRQWDKEFTLVGLLHIETKSAKLVLLTEDEIRLWNNRPDRDKYHINILYEQAKWNPNKTQGDVANEFYNVGNNGTLQRVLQDLKVKEERKNILTIEEINMKFYPITTNKGFFVGDPCYVIPKRYWDEYVDEYYKASERGYTHFNFRGVVVGGSNTKHGDGSYLTDDGDEIDVDAGIIGVTPLELIEDSIGYGGRTITGKHQASVEYKDGNITVSIKGEQDIEIQTGKEYDEDDYEDGYDGDAYYY